MHEQVAWDLKNLLCRCFQDQRRPCIRNHKILTFRFARKMKALKNCTLLKLYTLMDD